MDFDFNLEARFQLQAELEVKLQHEVTTHLSSAAWVDAVPEDGHRRRIYIVFNFILQVKLQIAQLSVELELELQF